jgi:hypothetical protein
MNDEQILNRGGDERDISEQAKQSGAELTDTEFKPDVEDWKQQLFDYLMRVWDIDELGSVMHLHEWLEEFIEILLIKKGLEDFHLLIEERDKLLKEYSEKVDNIIDSQACIYCHWWADTAKEKVCEGCREVVKKYTPCYASKYRGYSEIVEEIYKAKKKLDRKHKL